MEENISLGRARHIVCSTKKRTALEMYPLELSPGKVLQEEVSSREDIPPADISIVNGFVCQKDGDPGILTITGDAQEFIESNTGLEQGECARVKDGGKLPRDTNCIIPEKDTVFIDDTHIAVTSHEFDDYMIKQGAFLKKQKKVLEQGIQIQPFHVPLMSIVGSTQPKIARYPKTAVAVVGSYWVEPNQFVGVDQRCNTLANQVLAHLRRYGIPSQYAGIFPELPEHFYPRMHHLMEDTDLIILLGEMKKGLNTIPKLLDKEISAKKLFYGIDVHPIEHTIACRTEGNGIIIGLSGNSLSAFFNLEELVVPFLFSRMGIRDYEPKRILQPLKKPVSPEQYTYDQLNLLHIDEEGAEFVRCKGLNDILALSKSNGYTGILPRRGSFKKGELIPVRFLNYL